MTPYLHGNFCSPDIFQERISNPMEHLMCEQIYLQNILVQAKGNLTNLISELEPVPKILTKSKFTTYSVNYLGHRLSRHDISPLPNRIEATLFIRPSYCTHIRTSFRCGTILLWLMWEMCFEILALLKDIVGEAGTAKT